MTLASAESLQRQLERDGLVFTSRTLVHRGIYAPQDADWNYKDIPHLKEVHKQVEGIPAVIEDHLICNYFLQRLGPFRMPLAVTNYAFSPNSQVYFTAAFVFALVIETSWSSANGVETEVSTTYRIGSSRMYRTLHPLVHYLLKRNYHVLMAADIPMRQQRGKLRQRGYSFAGDSGGYGFAGTLRLAEENVIAPPIPLDTKLIEHSVPSTDMQAEQSVFVGSDDFNGVRLVKIGDDLWAFPRICPHEGASLDECELSLSGEPHLRCPWHGRKAVGKKVDSGGQATIGNCRVSHSSTEVVVSTLSGITHVAFEGS